MLIGMSFASDGIIGNAVRDPVIDNDQPRVEDGATKAQKLGGTISWPGLLTRPPLAPNLPGSVLGRLNTIDGKRALHPTNSARLNDVAKAGSPR